MPDLAGRHPSAVPFLADNDPTWGRLRVAAALSRGSTHRPPPPGPAMWALAAGESVAAGLMRGAEPDRHEEVSLWDGSRISFSRISQHMVREPA